MRGLIGLGLVVTLLPAMGGCIEDVSKSDPSTDAGVDADAWVDEFDPISTPRIKTPTELVGTWQAGPIDFELWENYKEGYYAGRNATPSRESMTFRADGSAKFYRYEFAFNLYENLVDCEGTVAFHGDGTFTFHPVECRKRFYDSRYSAKNSDRELTDQELFDPNWAGTRAYTYDSSSEPPRLRIVVPSSAPYYWYQVE